MHRLTNTPCKRGWIALLIIVGAGLIVSSATDFSFLVQFCAEIVVGIGLASRGYFVADILPKYSK